MAFAKELHRCFGTYAFLAAATLGFLSASALAQSAPLTGWESTTSTSLQAAGRILNQASFGPTVQTLFHVEQVGVSGYVDEQLKQPAYLMPATVPAAGYNSGDCFDWGCFPEALWWQDVLFGNDQLRQRVAFALSKLFVVSTLEVDERYFPAYLNILSQDAFGNWLTLMEDVATSSAMGLYLNSANSLVAPAGGHANENFARENMQLFSIGLVELNQDGSTKLDQNGKVIPTYTPAAIQDFARAFTGYTLANYDCSVPKDLHYSSWGYPWGAGCPMVPLDKYHDMGSKTLLHGQVLSAGQGAAADMSAALTNVFQDPSLPPFISRRLIQNLVKSNPTPGYINRIAGVFIDDGQGVRGNLAAVVRAILLDPEARAEDQGQATSADSGLLRDPMLEYASIFRALDATQNLPLPNIGIYENVFDVWLKNVGESPHTAPTVFSFYSPDYTIAGGEYAPEFQLENSYSLSWMILHTQDLLDNNFHNRVSNEFSLDLSATSPLGQIASSQGPLALVKALDALLMHGTMSSAMMSTVTGAVQGLSPSLMVRNATFLIVTAPEYRVMI